MNYRPEWDGSAVVQQSPLPPWQHFDSHAGFWLLAGVILGVVLCGVMKRFGC